MNAALFALTVKGNHSFLVNSDKILMNLVLDHVILNQKAKGAISNLFAMNIGTHDDIGRFYEDLPFKKGVDINEGNSDLWKQSRFKEINEINTIGLSEEHFFDKELEESSKLSMLML